MKWWASIKVVYSITLVATNLSLFLALPSLLPWRIFCAIIIVCRPPLEGWPCKNCADLLAGQVRSGPLGLLCMQKNTGAPLRVAQYLWVSSLVCNTQPIGGARHPCHEYQHRVIQVYSAFWMPMQTWANSDSHIYIYLRTATGEGERGKECMHECVWGEGERERENYTVHVIQLLQHFIRL